MLVTALTLVGYSVGISLVSAGIKRKCDLTATQKISDRIAALPEDHSEEDEQDIIKHESVCAATKFSIATGLVGVAGALVSTAIICNFDSPVHEIATEPGVDVDVTEDSTTVTVDGVQVTSF